ncbi:MAG: hypothetical protein J0I32_03345 [Sphingobacteriales bacterium]|nr:hypothetical protein [Sphingobacteriales bacterium]OJW05040.1 MAG: hypothetical protein BGO52_21405 [Sphingobacteriales bacterium 44-61]
MKHLSANKKNIKSATGQESKKAFEPEIFADSLEVMESYCMQKIVLLQSSLEKLTIADNTREIISVCQQIKKERNLLLQIIEKKNQARKNIC